MTAKPTQLEDNDQPAWRSVRAWLTLLLVLAAGLGLDLVSKSMAFHSVADEPVVLDREVLLGNSDWRPPWHEGVTVLPWGLLDFDLVVNHGAVFGIGQERRGVFVVFTIVAIVVALSIFAFKTRAKSHWVHVGIALILAGGLGNLVDRLQYGAVRDFLHMLPEWSLPFGFAWPGGNTEVFPWIFNVADVLLLAGMAILILRSSPSPPSHAEQTDRALDVDQQSKIERVE